MYMLFFIFTAYILCFRFTAYMLFKGWFGMHYTINTLDQLKPVLIGYRKSQGLSQKDMATKLGIKQQSYQYLESNPQRITVDRLFRVLTLLGVKLHLSDNGWSTETTSISVDSNSVNNSQKEIW